MTMTRIDFALGRGERLLWSGAPRQGLVFRPTDLFQVPFSLLWAGFAVFWNVTVWVSGGPLFFRLWGLPFLAVGAYITVGRFWVDARRRARTTYGLTTERILIASGGLGRTLTSLSLRTLTDVTLSQRPDGSGTITFGPSSVASSMYAGTPWPGVRQPPSFELIENARRVYDAIRDAQEAAGRAA